MQVFDENGYWNDEFMRSPPLREFNTLVRKMFADHPGDIRHLAHALQAEVGMIEAMTMGTRRRKLREQKP